MKKPRHFLSVTDFSEDEIWKILRLAKKLKSSPLSKHDKLLRSKTLVMLFEKPSLRTRLSFEIGMTQLGGHAIYLAPTDISMGKRESVADIAKVTSRMADIIMARTFEHSTIEELANNSSVPVINGLSNLEHPCQILADLMTIYEVKKKLKNLKIAYLGDCENNVTHSLALAGKVLGYEFTAAGPKGYWMDKGIIKRSKAKQLVKPEDAVRRADVVITDTWVSMGDEKEKKERVTRLSSYQVNKKLMDLAKKDAIFMHCLPAYRGFEVASEVIDGPRSVVFQEAENRLHTQKSLILFLLGVI